MARRAQRPGPRCEGFTLLEMMVTLFIVAVALSLVLPAFSTDTGRLNAEARRVASILRYMNETSALKKQTLDVRFELDEGLVSWDSDTGRKTERVEGLRGVELQSKGLLNEGQVTVFFGPSGIAEHIRVYLGGGGEERVVTLNPVSGRVNVL